MEKIKRILIEKKKLEVFIFIEGGGGKDYSKVIKKYRKLCKVLCIYDVLIKSKDSESILLKELNKTKDPELMNLIRDEVANLNLKTAFTARVLECFFTHTSEVFKKTKGDSIIVEIRSGAGGEEASLFVNKLYRMYTRYISSLGVKYDRLHFSMSDKGGFKYVCFKIHKNIENFLRFESGVHRIQRVPITESSGRVHTSTATVAVLPEADEVEVVLKEQDLRITVCKSSGPGGQGVNTTDSAVQIMHKPTGLTATCSDQRTQQKNKAQALSVLRSRLLNLSKEQCEREYSDFRKKQIGLGSRSEKVRTYNFIKNRVTDHRTNVTVHSLEKIIDGVMDELYSKLPND